MLSVVALAPIAARAEDRALADAVVVSTADDCLAHAALVEHLVGWLERDVVDARLGVVLHVGESGVAIRVVRDGEAVAGRTFEHLPAACADRRAAVSLAIALAIDGVILPALEPPDAPDPVEPDVTPPHAQLGVRLFAEGGALFVGLPDVVPAARIGLALGTELSVTLSGSYAGAAVSQLGTGRVALSVALAELGGCYARTVDPRLALEGCVVVAAGAVRAEGKGYDVSRAADLAIVGAGARLVLRVPLAPWLALRVAGDVSFPFVRPRWLVESAGAEHDAGTYGEVGASAWLGLEVVLDAP